MSVSRPEQLLNTCISLAKDTAPPTSLACLLLCFLRRNKTLKIKTLNVHTAGDGGASGGERP